MNINLGSRKADTGSCVHGFEHIVDELSQLGVELGHRLRSGAQPLIGEFQDGSDGHDANFRYLSKFGLNLGEKLSPIVAILRKTRYHSPHRPPLIARPHPAPNLD